MATRKGGGAPTEAEILSYDNVPVDRAAAYIGLSISKTRDGLIQRRAPFGYAIHNEESGTWTYQISPGLLVKYKNGELALWALNEVVQQLVAQVESVLELRSKVAIEVLCPGLLQIAANHTRKD